MNDLKHRFLIAKVALAEDYAEGAEARLATIKQDAQVARVVAQYARLASDLVPEADPQAIETRMWQCADALRKQGRLDRLGGQLKQFCDRLEWAATIAADYMP